ncbi:MAG: transcriptional repressor LexA [Sulfuricaulis sp.]
MDSLTKRQSEILKLIRSRIARFGYPPTRAEIRDALGFRSPNAADEHLKAMARKGAIELLPGTARGIRLKEEGVHRQSPGRGLPVVGQVAAGEPMLAEQGIEAYYRVDPKLFRPRADYLLRVRGQSMRDAGILNGDLLAVHRQAEASNGEIVVVRLEDDVTVKRFQRRGAQVQLLPENPEFEPIEIDLRRRALVIEGIGVGVIRHKKFR